MTIYAFRKKDVTIRTTDKLAFSGAILGIILWRLTNNPLLAVIMVMISDVLGFVPTFRKTYHEPHTETLFEYAMASAKFVVALFALQSYNLTTWLYPALLVLTNAVFVVMALIRRKQMKILADSTLSK